MISQLNESWNENYQERVKRNIGMVSIEEQEVLRTAKIAVLGTGGIGAPLAINLAYAGIQNFVLADFDRVDYSNLNRQPFTEKDVGRLKVHALARRIKEINSKSIVDAYTEIAEENIHEILEGVDVVVLSLDGPVGSLLVARKAREYGIPMVEGWATPIVFARWFTKDSWDYEKTYGLNTADKTVEQIKNAPEIQQSIRKAFMQFFLSLPDIERDYEHEPGFKRAMLRGEIGLRSFAPTVWAVSIFLAHEVVFAGLLQRKQKALAPEVKGFDYMRMQGVHVPPSKFVP